MQMKRSKTKKRMEHYTLLAIASVTAITVLVSGLMLLDRVGKFAEEDNFPCTVINLNEDNVSNQSASDNMMSVLPETTISGAEVSRMALTNNDVTFSQTATTSFGDPFILEPGFEVYDDNVVWQTMTDVEIFKVTYDEQGDISVDGTDDKVFAPGTGNSYKFVLENTGETPIEYTMEVEAFFSNKDVFIPIETKFHDYEGNYYVGGEGNSWEPALELNRVRKTEELDVGRHRTFTLDWQWPFEDSTEGGDVYDTMLGNMAVDEDLELTIIIRTVAQADEIPLDPGGETGDDNTILICSIILVAALGLIVILAIIKKKREADEDESEYENNQQ